MSDDRHEQFPTSHPDGTPKRLLIVDDNQPLRERLARAMDSRGLNVATAENYDHALAQAEQFKPDIAVVDLRMPGKSGLELLRDMKAKYPDMLIVVLTGFGSIATAVDAMKLGATNYVAKPADADDILAAFSRGASPALSGSTSTYEAPTLARAEWEHINRVLSDCNGNVSEAARRLGLHRRSLQRKLQKRAPEESPDEDL